MITSHTYCLSKSQTDTKNSRDLESLTCGTCCIVWLVLSMNLRDLLGTSDLRMCSLTSMDRLRLELCCHTLMKSRTTRKQLIMKLHCWHLRMSPNCNLGLQTMTPILNLRSFRSDWPLLLLEFLKTLHRSTISSISPSMRQLPTSWLTSGEVQSTILRFSEALWQIWFNLSQKIDWQLSSFGHGFQNTKRTSSQRKNSWSPQCLKRLKRKSTSWEYSQRVQVLVKSIKLTNIQNSNTETTACYIFVW